MSEMKEQIRSQYLKSLQGRVDSLMAQIEKYYEGSDMAEQNLRMIAHALHGSGSTFGFPEITRASAEVEESVGEEIIARIRVLIQVLEEVIAGNAVKTEYDQTVQDNGGMSDDCKHVLVVEALSGSIFLSSLSVPLILKLMSEAFRKF